MPKAVLSNAKALRLSLSNFKLNVNLEVHKQVLYASVFYMVLVVVSFDHLGTLKDQICSFAD